MGGIVCITVLLPASIKL